MRFIRLNKYNKITSIRNGKSIVVGELKSDDGELGQIMQEDGTFIDDIQELSKQEYQVKESEATQDLKDLQDAILRRDATQEDFDTRVAEWQAYKTQWEADNE